MSALVDELRQKAKGQRNSVGDLWGDWICDKAADELTTLQSRLEAVEAERDEALVRARIADKDAEIATAHWQNQFEEQKARAKELQKALESIAFMRPMGATPKLIKSELIERIEKLALSVLYRTKKEQHG